MRALAGIFGFHADTVGDLVAAFHEAVDDYVATCASAGKSRERPYSGKLMLWVEPLVRAPSVLAAELAGASLNQWSVQALAKATGARAV